MFSKAFSSLLVALVSLHLVSAHFTLDFPTTRGFSEEKEASFCGGFPTNASGRSPFPLSGPAPVRITSHHDVSQVGIILSVKPDPTKFADFNSTGKIDYLMPFANITGQKGFCFSVDISTLASQISPAPANGTLATLQVVFNGGDSPLFQCSDLILVKDANIASNQTCTNADQGAKPSAKSGAGVNVINFTLFISMIIISTLCIDL